jgi:hypothetical protein
MKIRLHVERSRRNTARGALRYGLDSVSLRSE